MYATRLSFVLRRAASAHRYPRQVRHIAFPSSLLRLPIPIHPFSTTTSSTSTSSSSSSTSTSTSSSSQEPPNRESTETPNQESTENQQDSKQQHEKTEEEKIVEEETKYVPPPPALNIPSWLRWFLTIFGIGGSYIGITTFLDECQYHPEWAIKLIKSPPSLLDTIPRDFVMTYIIPYLFYSTVAGKRAASQSPELFETLFSVLDDPTASQDDARAVTVNLFTLAEVDTCHIEFAGRMQRLLQLCVSPDKETSCFATMTLTKAITHPLIRREFIAMDGLRYTSRLTRSTDPDVSHYGHELLSELIRDWPEEWNLKTLQKKWEKSFLEQLNAAIFQCGGIALDSGMFKIALLCFERAIALDPSNANAYWCKGQAQDKLGFHEAARDSWKKCTEMHPGHPEASYLLLSYYIKHESTNIDGLNDALDRIQLGLDALKAQLKLHEASNPATAAHVDLNIPAVMTSSYFMQINALEQLGRMDEALIQSLEWVLLMPYNAQAHFTRGRLLVKEKNYTEAIEELQNSTQLDPTKGEPLYQLALAHYKHGRDITSHNKQPTLEELQHDYQQAQYYVRQALKTVNFDPDNPNVPPSAPKEKKEYKGPIPVSVILPPVSTPSDPKILIPASLRLLARIETAQAISSTTSTTDVQQHLHHALSYANLYLERRPRDIDAQLNRAEILQRLGDIEGSYQQYQRIIHTWLQMLPRQGDMIPNSAVKKFFDAPERIKQKDALIQLENTCKGCQTKPSTSVTLNALCDDLKKIKPITK